MELTIAANRADDGKTTLQLTGSLDLVSRDDLLAAGRDALGDPDSRGLVLNLAQVGFMDSTGIGALVELSRAAEDAGKTFALQDPSARVQRVLTLTGLEDNWELEPSAS